MGGVSAVGSEVAPLELLQLLTDSEWRGMTTEKGRIPKSLLPCRDQALMYSWQRDQAGMCLSSSPSLPTCVRDAVEKHLPPLCLPRQIKAVIKIQAFVRANKARGDYRMLGKCLLIAALKGEG